MSRGRHAAPRESHMPQVVAGGLAAATLTTGGLVAITPAMAQAATLPAKAPTVAAEPVLAAPALQTAAATTRTHVVASGETLSGIAPTVGETWQRLYADNRAVIGGSPDLILPGQALTVGAAAPAPVAPRAAASVAVQAPPPPVEPVAQGRHAAAVTGADIVASAHAYLGVPYVWGGASPAGMDCSGLVVRVYADNGISLPHSSLTQSTIGTRIASLADAQPGDLLFFDNPVGHVGIYVGGGMMEAAPTFGDHVKIQSVYTTPTVIRRLV